MEFRARLNNLHDIINVHEIFQEGTYYDFLLFFVKNSDEILQSAKYISKHLIPDGILWYAYPKKTTKQTENHLTRYSGWDSVEQLGFEAVRQVAIDQDWSAIRFREKKYIRNLLSRQKREITDIKSPPDSEN
jgi:hypothetical protein